MCFLLIFEPVACKSLEKIDSRSEGNTFGIFMNKVNVGMTTSTIRHTISNSATILYLL